MASRKNLDINKKRKKMMVNLNTLLKKEIERLKDLQEIRKNPNMLLSRETLMNKKGHKNQKETI